MIEKRIHASRLCEIMERSDQNGQPTIFSVEFVKRSTGQVVRYEKAVMTSMHAAGTTVNIREIGAVEPRKIRRCLIIRFNDAKVFL